MIVRLQLDFSIHKLVFTACLVIVAFICWATGADVYAKRPVYINHITSHYSAQLTPPPTNNRKSLSQFGYNLQLFRIPLFFPITDFIDPEDFGEHSYHKGEYKEENGALYTCEGGFIDFSHLRTAADWTVYLTFKILIEYKNFDLPHESGSLQLKFKNLEQLSLEDIASMAEKISFERLLWHEAASWYYHWPNHLVGEQRSAFTPEDIYSNMLGAEIGKNIVLRILTNFEQHSYSHIASEEIEKAVAALHPVETKAESRAAYDVVDRTKQLKLPAEERNYDVWWDGRIIFQDQRYAFKRYMNIGPQIDPWLVPQPAKAGCAEKPVAHIITVPQTTEDGVSLYKYYEFRITPDSSLFYAKRTGRKLHEPFESFTTRDYCQVILHISGEMEKKLLRGFDERNKFDPVPYYRKARRVLFKIG